MSDLQAKLQDLANEYHVPSITTWRQGKFIESPKYNHMGERWKYDQEAREETLIRPGGGVNNALFQVSGNADNANVAKYLQAVAELLEAADE